MVAAVIQGRVAGGNLDSGRGSGPSQETFRTKGCFIRGQV